MFVITGLIGLVMLVGGAEFLVRGGGQLALALKVPALVVGLTIVAFGTSTPELAVSTTAAFQGNTDMALANVTGSNIANIALVLGGAALVHPLRVERALLLREIPVLLILQLLVPLFCLNGMISRFEGGALFLVGTLYNLALLVSILRRRVSLSDVEDLDDELGEADDRWWIHVVYLIGGLAILILGSQLFVSAALTIVDMLGLSHRFVGLSILALGTSAPEFATAIVSARRGEVELAVGNSIGSNLLNIAMVLGITAMVKPIVVADASAWNDLGAAVVMTLVLTGIVAWTRLGRVGGALMMLSYVGYLFLAHYMVP